jgi:hypothetical protein
MAKSAKPTKPKAPTKRELSLLQRIREAGSLAQRNDVQIGRFFLPTTGRTVDPELVSRCLRKGFLVANGDGLFGDSQTYRVAEPAQ